MAQVKSAAFTGVALVSTSDGRVISELERFDDPTSDQAGGAFDGSYAVWKDYRTPADLSDFTVHVWNRQSGAVRTVGAAHRDAHGAIAPSPWQDPVVSGGYAAWVEGLDQAGRGEIVLLDLHTMRRHIVRRGHPGWLALTPHLLIWSESPTPGAETVVHAMEPSTRRAVPVPVALANATGAWGFVSDGQGWAWVGDDSKAVYLAPSADQAPTRVMGVSMGGFSPPLTMVHGALAVPLSAGGLVLVNTRTRSYAVLPDAGFASAAGTSLLVRQENRSKQTTVRSPAEISGAALSAMHC